MKDKYIQEISDYQDILGLQVEREYDGDFGYGISEKESVYADINCYFDNDVFDEWDEDSFKTYILYLEHLTGITNTLGIKKESDNNV